MWYRNLQRFCHDYQSSKISPRCCYLKLFSGLTLFLFFSYSFAVIIITQSLFFVLFVLLIKFIRKLYSQFTTLYRLLKRTESLREFFLEAFKKLRKATMTLSYLSFGLAVRMEQLGSYRRDFHEILYLRIFGNLWKIKVSLTLKTLTDT